MKYPLSELVDRYSILHLKMKRLPQNTEIADEYERFGAAVREFGVSDEDEDLKAMIAINGRIWDLESEIRRGLELPLEEVGRRALAIRDINAERIALKNRIAKCYGEFEEIKVDHGSSKQS